MATNDLTVYQPQEPFDIPLDDRFRDLRQNLALIARYAPEADVRTIAENGLNAFDLIVREHQELVGALKTALAVVKQQRDDAYAETEGAFEEGFMAGTEDGNGAEVDDAYNTGVYDGSVRAVTQVEATLGMTLDDAARLIKEIQEYWANNPESAA